MQGIVYVVDSGFSKQRFYNPVMNLSFKCLIYVVVWLVLILASYNAKLFLVILLILPTPLVSVLVPYFLLTTAPKLKQRRVAIGWRPAYNCHFSLWILYRYILGHPLLMMHCIGLRDALKSRRGLTRVIPVSDALHWRLGVVRNGKGCLTMMDMCGYGS